MARGTVSPETDIDVEDLILAAVPVALDHQDVNRFLDWMRSHIRDYVSPALLAESAPGLDRAFAYSFGRSLWNSLPLPRNRYRPEPMPEPGRNEPCPCGSGAKYKHCCAQAPHIALQPEEIWPLILDAMTEAQREAALRSGVLPRSGLVTLASKLYEAGDRVRVVKLLEPLFTPTLAGHDDLMEFAFDTLCDTYNGLEYSHKKALLVDNVLAHTPRSPLRAAAWQRRSLMSLDQHDLQGAREAFLHAQQDDPEAPATCVLEVQLLIAEHQSEKAKERANFLVRQLRRRGLQDNDPALEFLITLARDPLGALSEISLEQAGEAGRGLRIWLKAQIARPVPEYRTVNVEELPTTGAHSLVERLVKQGINRGEAEKAAKQLELDMPAPPEAADSPTPRAQPTLHCLSPVAELSKVENSWHEVFPLAKPFSVQSEPFGDADAWDPESERRWLAVLQKHPESFDSLDILDDLATALMQHPQGGTPWFEQETLLPLLRRSQAIVEEAIAQTQNVQLDWGWADNRPPLRALARLVTLLRAARPAEALTVAERLLSLNPNDNHGYRGMIINEYLKKGENLKAADLTARFPDDATVEVAYGEALALFRLGKPAPAERRLRGALKRSTKVIDYLLRDKVRKPKLQPGLVTFGGDDEAWYYREDMRTVWLDTPGAAGWLRTLRVARHTAPRGRRKTPPRVK